MNCKKWICLALALVLTVSLAACAGSDTGKIAGVSYTQFLDPALQEDEKDLLALMPEPSLTLDPQQIYDSLEYNERMFCGEYRLYNYDKELSSYAKTAKYIQIPYADSWNDTVERSVSSLPVAVSLGASAVNLGRFDREHYWARLSLVRENTDYSLSVTCTFTVSGKTITFTPVETLETLYDENFNTIGYDYTLGTQSLTYEFAFDGPRLTLSNADGSVTLYTTYFCKDRNPHVYGMLAADSPSIGNIDSFSYYIHRDFLKTSVSGYMELVPVDEDYNYARSAGIRLYDNGLVDVFWQEYGEKNNHPVHHAQYVYLGTYPMVFTDGKEVYYYTDTYTTRQMALMGDGMSTEDLIAFDSMSESEQKNVVQKKADLLKDLSAAYEAAGLSVQIDYATGEIAMDAGVLFGHDQAQITAEGKAFLKEFLAVYTGVVFGEEYTDFVSKIMVEGHTDTSGAYDYNKRLSLQRAENVMAFCLSEESGMDTNALATLQSTLEAIGYSYDKPVYKENGEVDMDASRRVSFRFVINIG